MDIALSVAVKAVAGILVFAAILFAGRRPEPIFQRAAGMLLTFPALNGIALVMTDTSQTAEKAAVMFPLIFFNGLMFLGFMLNFERLRKLKRPPAAWIAICGAAATGGIVAWQEFKVPAGWQAASIAAACAVAVWLSISSLPDRPVRENPSPKYLQKSDGVRFLVFTILLIALLLLGQFPQYTSLTGRLSALPLPGLFGVLLVSTSQNASHVLRQMRETVLFGPLIAMGFVFFLWPIAGHASWHTELVTLLVRGWGLCVASILLISFMLGLIEEHIRNEQPPT